MIAAMSADPPATDPVTATLHGHPRGKEERAARVGQSAMMAAQQLRLISALVLLLGIGLFMALPFVLSIGAVVFLPLVTAIILSIILSPLADQLARTGLPNALASSLALVALLALILAAMALIVLPAIDLVDDVPAMLNQASRQLMRLRSNMTWFNDLNEQLARITGRTNVREVVVATPSLFEKLAVATPSFVLETILTLLMTFFLLEGRVKLRRHLLLDRTSFGSSLKAARVVRDIHERVGGYFVTVALINLGVGVVTAFGAWALGWNAPIMWGGLAALVNFIPYLGPLTMIAVLGVAGLATSESLVAGVMPALAYLGLHTVEANLVTPSILGRRFTVNPVLILLSFSYFTWIWGVLGALLSVPILITLTALFEHLGSPNLVGFVFGEPLFPSLPDLATGEEDAPDPQAHPHVHVAGGEANALSGSQAG